MQYDSSSKFGYGEDKVHGHNTENTRALGRHARSAELNEDKLYEHNTENTRT